MKIYFTKTFKKHYLKRIYPNKNLDNLFRKKVKTFSINKKDLLLKDHSLGGKMKGFRAFSITGDIRIIYYLDKNIVYFVDIGSHNQVY